MIEHNYRERCFCGEDVAAWRREEPYASGSSIPGGPPCGGDHARILLTNCDTYAVIRDALTDGGVTFDFLDYIPTHVVLDSGASGEIMVPKFRVKDMGNFYAAVEFICRKLKMLHVTAHFHLEVFA